MASLNEESCTPTITVCPHLLKDMPMALRALP
jgi:hypothetical protein